MPLETESGTSSGSPPSPTDPVVSTTPPWQDPTTDWTSNTTYTKDEFAPYFAPVGGASASESVLDITQIEYQVLAILPDGSTADLSQTVEQFTWDELKGEWAMRFSVTLRDTSSARGQIHEILSLGGKISFWWRLGHGNPGPDWQPIGLGTCWDWEYTDDGLPSITGTLYDDLMFALKSDALMVLWPPTDASNVLYELFKPWAIPLALPWDGPSTTIQRRLKLSGSVADCVQQVLAEAFIAEQTPSGYGQEYFPRMEFDGSMARLAIRKPGTNSTIWTFAPYQATSRVSVKWSMEELITQLKVTGSDGNQTFVVPPLDANAQNWGPLNFTLNGC